MSFIYLLAFIFFLYQKLGIKDAKGMEFDDVVLIDFFCGLPEKVQDWWKKRFQNSSVSPEAETQVEKNNFEHSSQLMSVLSTYTLYCTKK